MAKNGRAGVALGKGKVGFADGSIAQLDGAPSAMKAGDVIAVAPNGTNSYAVRSVPEVGGGMVVQNPINGRVLAIQGGFDNRISSFNRATQAQRQPGSTIKPFVYATALDNGMTPTSIIVDGPYCVWQGASLGQKCFRNFTGGGSGPHTMRWGLEQSRNLMTVRAASQTGMDRVVKCTVFMADMKEWPAMNVVYAASAYPFGWLSDRMSHATLLAWGLMVLIAGNLVFAHGTDDAHLLMGVALWGVHMGMTQGLLATMVAATAPDDLRGTAFGFFNLLSGVAMLLSSAIAGLLWDGFGSAVTFCAGAGFATLALVVMLGFRLRA